MTRRDLSGIDAEGFVGEEWICTVCGHLFDADCAGHPPCPECPPNRWASKTTSPAGRYALHRFHQARVPFHICPDGLAPACPHVTPGPSLKLIQGGIEDTGPLTLCGNAAAPDGGPCAAHDPKPEPPPKEGQLDLFSDLFA